MNNDELKKLLETENEECPICLKTIYGTDFDRSEHRKNCALDMSIKEFARVAEQKKREEEMRKELEKLL